LRKFLLHSLFAVFLTANITKWYATIGSDVRIYYNHAALLLWIALAAPYLRSLRFQVPFKIKLLLLLRGLFICAVIIGIPTLQTEFEGPVLLTYVKAVVVALLEGSGLLLMLLFVTKLQPAERQTIVNLYLATIAFTLTCTLLQGWLIYYLNVDLDGVIATHLPFWNDSIPNIQDEVFGLSSGTYYRLSGLTGDPNLNGMIMLVALPLVFYKAFEHGNQVYILMLFLLIWAIVLTISNAAILISLPVLILMILRYRNRIRRIKLIFGIVILGLIALMLSKYSSEIQECIAWKLDKHGTFSSHEDIANEALSIWHEHPWGVGANSYPRYSQEFSAHNSYLQSLVELGPLGLLLGLGWCLVGIVLCWRVRDDLGYAIMVAIGALALGALGHDVLNRYEFQMPLNLLVAIAILNHRDFLHAIKPNPEQLTHLQPPVSTS